MKQEEKELDAAGSLYVVLTEHKKPNPATPSPLSVGTPGDKGSGPVENRFRDILEKRPADSVKQERNWKWVIRQSRNQLRGISPLRNCCRT